LKGLMVRTNQICGQRFSSPAGTNTGGVSFRGDIFPKGFLICNYLGLCFLYMVYRMFIVYN
ncbi:hypothetical protein D0T84_14595, partial [Dysgonomonas sp. 521]|uniref:hypothetical protein n=1 Tax=Dysgonomonas sp. 521 TaxID=2302932 RepID=UPI001C876530